MQRSRYLEVGLCLALVLMGASDGHARRPPRGGSFAPAEDPLAMGMPFAWPDPESPWGPAPYVDYGSWSPTGGLWEDMLKSGATTGWGARWKTADFTGDILPPSSTYMLANYRYAFLKDEADIQVVAPGGFIGDVGDTRIHLLELGISQRFIGPARRGIFVDVGTEIGIGGVDGEIYRAAPTPGDERIFVNKIQENGFIVRGAMTMGAGWQLGRADMRFGISAGLSGSNAMTGRFRAQGDLGARVGATLYLFE